MNRPDSETEELKSGNYMLVGDDEDIQAQPVFLHAPRKKNLADGLGGWTISWQGASTMIAAEKRLNLTDHRVLRALEGTLDFENWIRVSLTEIGDPIGIARQNVSTSMKKLLELNIVLPGPSVKNIKTYRLNPAVGWKGDLRQGAKERRAALKVVQGGKTDAPAPTQNPDQLPLF